MTTYAFPSTLTTENPISDGGNWGNAASGTWTNPVTTTAGTPGSAQGPGSSGTNDAIALLQTGSWGRAQDVSLTASVSSPTGNPELEPNLHGTQNATQTFGYEGDTIWNTNKWDCVIARWDGNQGNVTVIGSGSFLTSPADGDVIRHFDDGSGNMTMKVNGTTVCTSTTDTTYTTGRPWIGFDVGAGSGVVCKGYTATDGVTPTGNIMWVKA